LKQLIKTSNFRHKI